MALWSEERERMTGNHKCFFTLVLSKSKSEPCGTDMGTLDVSTILRLSNIMLNNSCLLWVHGPFSGFSFGPPTEKAWPPLVWTSQLKNVICRSIKDENKL